MTLRLICLASTAVLCAAARPATAETIPWLFYQVRKRLGDIQATFPQGVQGPFFNDEFGDVFGNVYAFTADGLSMRQLRDYVEQVRTGVLGIESIGKTQVIGAREEVIYLDFSVQKLAALGIDMQSVVNTLQAQNAVQPSGVIQAGPEQVSVRVGGQFTDENSLRAINLRINDRFFRLTDVAEISRGLPIPRSSSTTTAWFLLTAVEVLWRKSARMRAMRAWIAWTKAFALIQFLLNLTLRLMARCAFARAASACRNASIGQ